VIGAVPSQTSPASITLLPHSGLHLPAVPELKMVRWQVLQERLMERSALMGLMILLTSLRVLLP